MPLHVSTYNKGIDRDSSKNRYPAGSYFQLKNMRITSFEQLSNGAIQSMKGNVIAIAVPGGYSSHIVIGLKVIRNYLVAWSTNNNTATGGLGTIWRADLANQLPVWTKVFESAMMNLSAQHPIADEAIGYYESDDIIKVYWTDNYNMLRFINIAGSSFPLTIGVDKLNILPNTTFVAPVPVNIVGGNQQVGKVQYAFQYYNRHSVETTFGPCSPLIHLVKSSEGLTGTNARFYEGAEVLNDEGNPNDSGKGVVLSLTGLDTTYEMVRVVAIHYSNLNQVPVIHVVGEYELASTITVVDTGNYALGTITLNAFRSLGNHELYVKTITQKGNKALIGNVREKFFDFDWDARAYRYGPYDTGGGVIGKRITVYHAADDTEYVINSNGVAWPNTTYTMTFGGVLGPVPSSHDCINPFNYDYLYPGGATIDEEAGNPAYYGAAGLANNPATGEAFSSNQYMWQSDIDAGTGIGTIGGEGPHVKYEIITTTMTLDVSAITRNIQPGQTTIQNLTSFSDQRSPFIAELYMHHKSDEVYRYGIEFINARGQVTPVKWIGDIKFPCLSAKAANALQIASNALRAVTGRIMGIKFYVDTTIPLAQGAVAMRIVRVKREEKDRTILTQGIVSMMCYDSNAGRTWFSSFPRPFMKSLGVGSGLCAEYARQTNLLQLMSPEINYFKDLEFSQTDYIKYVARLGGSNERYSYLDDLSATVDGLPNDENVFIGGSWGTKGYKITSKYVKTNNVANTRKYNILSGTLAGAVEFEGDEENKITLAGVSKPVVNRIYDYTAAGILNHRGVSGTCGVMLINTAADITELVDPVDLFETFLVDYKRPGNAAGQYGGITYAARQNNIYIDAGPYTSIIGGGVITMDCYRGDTFVNIFEHLRSMWEVDDNNGSGAPDVNAVNRILSVVMFPVETVINTYLDHGAKFSRFYDNSEGHGIRETAGTWYSQDDDAVFSDASDVFVQEEDMYQYNTVYSQQSDARINIPAPYDYETEVKEDTLVKISLEKTAGEQVDSYLKFLTDNEKLLPTHYGPLNKLFEFRNFILAFFDGAMGTLSVDERAVLPIQNNTLLELGSADNLKYFDYISNKSGSMHPQSISAGENGFVWFDAVKGFMGFYNGQAQDLGLVQGISSDIKSYKSLIRSLTSYYNNPFNGGNVLCFDNPKYKEILCALQVSELAAFNSKVVGTSVTFDLLYSPGNYSDARVIINGEEFIAHSVTGVLGTGQLVINTTDNPSLVPGDAKWAAGWFLIYYKDLSKVISFSSLNGAFILEADIFPTWFAGYGEDLYDVFGKFLMYKENEGNYGEFYGIYRKGEIEYLINPKGSIVCVFNNYEYGMEATVSGENSVTETWDTVRLYNDYQWSAGTGIACTFTTGTNLITQNAHGYVSGDEVMFSGGSIPVAILNTKKYYVINPTANTFQVSLSMNGTPIAFANGSGLCHPIDIPIVVSGTYNDKRRMRTWRIKDLRDMKGYVSGIVKPRLRDAYIRIRFKYQHTNNNRIIMHDLMTYYTPTREALGNY